MDDVKFPRLSPCPCNDISLSLRAKRSNPGEESEIAASQTPRNDRKERKRDCRVADSSQ
ncbi:MAG: hypothetical protein U9P63_00095 [Patescibacteria group bacterium]|nr:hypothetical protein [Patescibacteria group bacterium]